MGGVVNLFSFWHNPSKIFKSLQKHFFYLDTTKAFKSPSLMFLKFDKSASFPLGTKNF